MADFRNRSSTVKRVLVHDVPSSANMGTLPDSVANLLKNRHQNVFAQILLANNSDTSTPIPNLPLYSDNDYRPSISYPALTKQLAIITSENVLTNAEYFVLYTECADNKLGSVAYEVGPFPIPADGDVMFSYNQVDTAISKESPWYIQH